MRKDEAPADAPDFGEGVFQAGPDRLDLAPAALDRRVGRNQERIVQFHRGERYQLSGAVMQVGAHSPQMALVQGNDALRRPLDAGAQQVVLGKQARELADPAAERRALPDDGAAAAQRDRRERRKKPSVAQATASHPQMRARNNVSLQIVRNLVEFGYRDHLAGPWLQDRRVDFEQWLSGLALGLAFAVLDLVEPGDQRAGEGLPEIWIRESKRLPVSALSFE